MPGWGRLLLYFVLYSYSGMWGGAGTAQGKVELELALEGLDLALDGIESKLRLSEDMEGRDLR